MFTPKMEQAFQDIFGDENENSNNHTTSSRTGGQSVDATLPVVGLLPMGFPCRSFSVLDNNGDS